MCVGTILDCIMTLKQDTENVVTLLEHYPDEVKGF